MLCGDLNEAQFGEKGFLAHELGVEADIAWIADFSSNRIDLLDHGKFCHELLLDADGEMFRIGRLTCDDCDHRFLSVAPLLPFLLTLFDITLLRKGPEHIPRSVVMLTMAILLWLFARLATLVLIRGSNEQIFVIEFFSAFFAICLYAMAIILARKNSRLLQAITAIIGVSAVMRVVYLIANSLFMPFLGEGIMPLVVIATILWSIAVKGHIIASAIGRHWYAGMAVALVVTIVQIAFELSVNIDPP